MHCIFIGGPLDGELLEVDKRLDRTPRPITEPYTITTLTVTPPEYAEYTIANGIARHESVSEEEVARRVYRWMSDWRSEPQLPGE